MYLSELLYRQNSHAEAVELHTGSYTFSIKYILIYHQTMSKSNQKIN